MLLDWAIGFWVLSLFTWGTSIILFNRITIKNVNIKIKDAGYYYLSTEDKVGFTLLSMALAATLPAHIAQRAIPLLFLDAVVAKKFFVNPRDKILGFALLASSILMFISSCFLTIAFGPETS